MTDKPRVSGSGEQQPAVIIRDKRRIDPQTGRPHGAAGGPASAGQSGSDQSGGQPSGAAGQGQAKGQGTGAAATGGKAGEAPPTGKAAASDAAVAAETAATAEPGARAGAGGKEATAGGATVDTGAAPDGATGGAPADGEAAVDPGTPLGAELEALRAELDERTSDLQRISAEYANYRKRVERDRGVVAEQATGAVLAALIPVLDDLDRAREHGDLVGPFGAVAEQLNAALAKFGLVAFGEKGDPFDPTRHEAVTHLTAPDVTESTCIDVMRRGYLLGERLLRPALVAVADPE